MEEGQGFVSVADYINLPCPGGSWVLEDLLPIGGYLNIYGDPKAGKSMIAAQFAAAIATEGVHSVLGFPIRKHGVVAYFQLDTPRAIWQIRFRNLQRKGHKFDRVYIADKHRVKYPFNIQVGGRDELLEHIRKLPEWPLVVVIDTLRKVHDGDENSSSVMKHVVEQIELATKPAGVILVSHAKKKGKDEEENLVGDARGSSYIPGEMDANMKVDRGKFTFSSRTASEARYQTKKASKDGEIVLNDAVFTEALELVRRAGPECEILDLLETLQKSERGKLKDEEQLVGTLQRARSILELEGAA